MIEDNETSDLLEKIRSCTICKDHLPFSPKPICSFSSLSRILLIGQAPDLQAHESGIPWDDASGDRLRGWLGVDSKQFYNEENFAIVPMGFCYPGSEKSGDLPPRAECAATWMEEIREHLREIELTILVGQYALDYFLGDQKKETLTLTIKKWKSYRPQYLVLPHPSPRNNIWLKKNPWFSEDVVPYAKQRVKRILVGSY